MLAIAKPCARPKGDPFYRPSGTDVSFCIISQHFVLGYFRQVPAGLISLNRHCPLLPISHKKPSEELQFHQFRGSFRILTFLMRRLAVAIARKGVDYS